MECVARFIDDNQYLRIQCTTPIGEQTIVSIQYSVNGVNLDTGL